MDFCQNATKTIGPKEMQTETMQKTCEGLGRIFSSLGEDFERIAILVMKGFRIQARKPSCKLLLTRQKAIIVFKKKLILYRQTIEIDSKHMGTFYKNPCLNWQVIVNTNLGYLE